MAHIKFNPGRRRTRWLWWAVVSPLLVWSWLAAGFSPFLPARAGLLLGLAWAGASVGGALASRGGFRWLAVVTAGIAIVAIAHFVRSPGNERDWLPDQERTVRVTFTGDVARVENLRNTVYADDGSVVSREWYGDSFSIGEVERVYYVNEILSRRGVVAHGFLSFAFADGRHLAVSVEARRSPGQSFDPVRGLFRNYELIYILGQEPDLIGMRAHVRENPVYVFPIRAEPDDVRKLFRSILVRADRLGREPEFYHTVRNNCVTNVLIHVNEATDSNLRYDLRILFPGFADGLIHQRGLLAFDGTLDEARQRFRIAGRPPAGTEPHDWSREIRLP